MSGIPGHGLYTGRVMHARAKPARRFVYRVFSLFLDIDAIDTAPQRCALLSRNRFNVLSFHDKDHGPRDGSALRPWVEACLNRAGIATRPDQIRLLCFPRLWGLVFNPISLFYCYSNGVLFAVVHEVNNTFGDSHAYVAPAAADAGGVARYSADKVLYVSPLLPMRARYDFAARAPGATLSFGIKEFGAEGWLLTAAQTGAYRPLTTWTALAAVLRHPLMTLKVVAAIHAEALLAWLRGGRPVERPLSPPGGVSAALAPSGRSAVA